MTRRQHFRISSKVPGFNLSAECQLLARSVELQQGEKDDAAYYFASVVKNYPKSPKAPDAMFKVGVIMQDKGDTAKAKAVYQQVVSKFPGTDGAKQAQKRLNALG